MNVIFNLVVFIILKSNLCVFSERDLTFKFNICYRPSVCCLLSVCNVRAPTQPVEIFGNAFGTLAIR